MALKLEMVARLFGPHAEQNGSTVYIQPEEVQAIRALLARIGADDGRKS